MEYNTLSNSCTLYDHTHNHTIIHIIKRNYYIQYTYDTITSIQYTYTLQVQFTNESTYRKLLYNTSYKLQYTYTE